MSQANAVSLADNVLSAIETGEFELPAFPAVLQRIQGELAKPNCDARVIAALVSQEPAVAATLLRAANSAIFGGLNPITSLNQAIARLGMNQVQSIVTAIVMNGEFGASIPWAKELIGRLWDHSIASGMAAKSLAKREEIDGEQAFMAGLLHGIGRLVVLRALDFIIHKDSSIQLTPTAIDEIVESIQAEVGSRTLTAWNLAEELQLATRFEEVPDEASKAVFVRIVAVSDLVAKKLGYHPKPDTEISLLDQESVEALDLRDVELAALLLRLEDEIQAIKDFL